MLSVLPESFESLLQYRSIQKNTDNGIKSKTELASKTAPGKKSRVLVNMTVKTTLANNGVIASSDATILKTFPNSSLFTIDDMCDRIPTFAIAPSIETKF